jgi:hypothetical protein
MQLKSRYFRVSVPAAWRVWFVFDGDADGSRRARGTFCIFCLSVCLANFSSMAPVSSVRLEPANGHRREYTEQREQTYITLSFAHVSTICLTFIRALVACVLVVRAVCARRAAVRRPTRRAACRNYGDRLADALATCSCAARLWLVPYVTHRGLLSTVGLFIRLFLADA